MQKDSLQREENRLKKTVWKKTRTDIKIMFANRRKLYNIVCKDKKTLKTVWKQMKIVENGLQRKENR